MTPHPLRGTFQRLLRDHHGQYPSAAAWRDGLLDALCAAVPVPSRAALTALISLYTHVLTHPNDNTWAAGEGFDAKRSYAIQLEDQLMAWAATASRPPVTREAVEALCRKHGAVIAEADTMSGARRYEAFSQDLLRLCHGAAEPSWCEHIEKAEAGDRMIRWWMKGLQPPILDSWKLCPICAAPRLPG